MKIRQCDKILLAMLKNKDKKEWTAKDFQSGEYFVGYEATARMSDLLRMYPKQIIAGKDGRFRTLSINWENVDEEFKKQVNGYSTES
jgi:hypothetical protein